jgi:hypothetical protein
MKRNTRNTRKTTKATTATKPATLERTAPQLFQGKVQALKVYRRRMPEFNKKAGNACEAYCWLIILPGERTTSTNTYDAEQTPKASWNPNHYAGPLNQKKVDKKIEEQNYEEVEVDEWPAWLINSNHK